MAEYDVHREDTIRGDFLAHLRKMQAKDPKTYDDCFVLNSLSVNMCVSSPIYLTRVAARGLADR